MTVRELKEILNYSDPEQEVKVCVNTPGGWTCPDGCVIGVKAVYAHGIDWHSHETLIVPEFTLDIHDVGDWENTPKIESGDGN